mmetsp:Transcript_72398/g.162095  ORF Transcript_72398/g.162095 Transcript_72398/m.162095 type:complete len:200 (+) Transcript_72398:190-789(+)
MRDASLHAESHRKDHQHHGRDLPSQGHTGGHDLPHVLGVISIELQQPTRCLLGRRHQQHQRADPIPELLGPLLRLAQEGGTRSGGGRQTQDVLRFLPPERGIDHRRQAVLQVLPAVRDAGQAVLQGLPAGRDGPPCQVDRKVEHRTHRHPQPRMWVLGLCDIERGRLLQDDRCCDAGGRAGEGAADLVVVVTEVRLSTA